MNIIFKIRDTHNKYMLHCINKSSFVFFTLSVLGSTTQITAGHCNVLNENNF